MYIKNILTKEQKKDWQKLLTKYYQIKNGTGSSNLSEDLVTKISYWEDMKEENEKLKKAILEYALENALEKEMR